MNWNVSRKDAKLIDKIVDRYIDLQPTSQVGCRMERAMDLTACHLNGCPLDLEGLLAAKDMDLIHDVWGLFVHIDRTNGKLQDCFVPRYAK